jgi:hypothetical protein
MALTAGTTAVAEQEELHVRTTTTARNSRGVSNRREACNRKEGSNSRDASNIRDISNNINSIKGPKITKRASTTASIRDKDD